MFLTPGSRASRRLAGNIIETTVYTVSQTITIPSGANFAVIQLQGGGGGAKGVGNACNGFVCFGGWGAYLEKSLPVIAGKTIVLTIGAGGSTVPTNGGNSTITSGSFPISTLTAGGGSLATSTAGNAVNQYGAGGTATGGDLNITGSFCTTTSTTSTIFGIIGNGLSPSVRLLSTASPVSSPGSLYGGGGGIITGISSTINVAGAAGGCIISWFK